MAGFKRGRPAKSVEQRKLEGTYRADRHGPAVHPVGGKPIKPAYLKGVASETWDDLEPRLLETGIVSDLDSKTFAAMCEFYALYREAAVEHEQQIAGLAEIAQAINRLAGAVAISTGGDLYPLAERISEDIAVLTLAIGSNAKRKRLDNMKAAYAQFSQIAARFGLTPVDRRAMRDVSTEKTEDDPMTRFLNRRLNLVTDKELA